MGGNTHEASPKVDCSVVVSCSLPNCDDLTKVHLHIVDLSDENGCQGLIERRPVHVNSGANRQYETCDSFVDSVVLLQAFEGNREGG